MNDIETLLREWDGLATVVRYDRPTGAWIFIALHDDTLGPAMGGTRIKVYSEPAEGLLDAQRLAEGMTHKWAGAGIPLGGGKAVLAVREIPEGAEREALLRRYGRLIASLRGTFSTGPDLGSSPADMAVIARETRHVHGVHPGGVIDPGPYTARGVAEAVRAVARRLFGSDDLHGRTVLVSGLGSVGAPLARRLHEAGATLLLSDVDRGRAEALAAELGGRVVAPEAVANTACDVFAPCAVGGVLDAETIPLLACRGVAGSANNQLGEPADAEALHARGILYAPDYVANSGGAIAFHLMAEKASEEEIFRRLDGIGAVLDEIFGEAAHEDRSPLWAARRRVERMLEERRA